MRFGRWRRRGRVAVVDHDEDLADRDDVAVLVVDLGDEVEILRRHVVQRTGAQDAGVADEAVDGTESAHRLAHQILDARGFWNPLNILINNGSLV